MLYIVFIVASFAEAWIEINCKLIVVRYFRVASFAEAWIEINRRENFSGYPGRLLRGGVD